MHIRLYMSQDAGALAVIFHDAVHQIGSLDYSEEQVAAWSSKPVSSEKFDQRVTDGRDIWVAIGAGNNPVGFIELEQNGHIDCFYCCPSHSGHGVGSALYQTLEDAAIKQGINSLFVEASEAAQRFFAKVGFSTQRRRNFQHNGVQIHNYSMIKSLER